LVSTIEAIDRILDEVAALPPEDRLLVVKRIVEGLLPMRQEHGQGSEHRSEQQPGLRYGAFSSGRESTEEDFRLAEWHPDEREWDG
jgi:hypothetical protein